LAGGSAAANRRSSCIAFSNRSEAVPSLVPTLAAMTSVLAQGHQPRQVHEQVGHDEQLGHERPTLEGAIGPERNQHRAVV